MHHPHHQPPVPEGAETATDPVCGMTVDTATAKHKADHKGRAFYFCSAGCKTKFTANPEKYLDADKAVAVPVAAGTIYTCPMHPEIRKEGPVSCPQAASARQRGRARRGNMGGSVRCDARVRATGRMSIAKGKGWSG